MLSPTSKKATFVICIGIIAIPFNTLVLQRYKQTPKRYTNEKCRTIRAALR